MKGLLFFFISILFFSCTEPFQINTENAEPKLVVYGVLTNEYKRQMISLTRSAPYFDENPNEAVLNAEVFIYGSNDTSYQLLEDSEYPGYYISEIHWIAKEGVTYYLDVKVDFDNDGVIDNYKASMKMPQTVYLDSISVDPIVIMGHNNYALNIYGQDSLEEDYYLFHVMINNLLITTTLSKYIIVDDALFNGQYIDGLTIQYFDDISERDKDSEEERKRSIYLKPGDLVSLHPAKIEKGYYDFISQCNKERNGENPMFGGPPSNIITNISNGAVGYFTGYSLSKNLIWVKNFSPNESINFRK